MHFQRQCSAGPRRSTNKALKRVRHEKPYQYKRKGNEEQAGFNTKVDYALAEAQLDLPDLGTSQAIERAHKAIERGR